QRLRNHYIGVTQGDLVLFSDFDNGGPMWSETGPREVRKFVEFEEAFRSAPTVQVGLSMWDLDNQTNLRADIKAENVTDAGFDLVFRTWSDTRIARVRANWMAIGELNHADEWDLY
ncbi:MAG: H-type lectin domain-containing protein, partial [Planktomarina sp.]